MKFTRTDHPLPHRRHDRVGLDQGTAQTVEDEIQVARSALKADRKATVASAVQLTEAEAKAFWPLYDEYRAEMDKSATLCSS